MGRRIRLGFDRVFAVSSTGFSKVAAACAQKWGIELREVEELSSEDFAPLLLTSKLEMFHRSYAIHSVFVQFHQDTSDDSKKLANRILAQALRPDCKNSAVLSFGYQSDCVSLDKLVDEYVIANQLADGVAPGVPKRFSMFCKGEPDRDDNWGVETDLGLVKVAFLTIDFELLVTAETHPLSSSARYRRVDAVAPISQTYSFSVPNYMGQKAEVEFLKLASSGGSYVSIFGNSEKGPVILMPYTVASPK